MDFLGGGQKDGEEYALILLNQPVADSTDFLRVWQRARYRVCADGAGTHFMQLYYSHTALTLPDAVVGDMDSITAEALKFYLKNGVMVERSECQNTTDLEKCFAHLQRLHNRRLMNVVVYGAFGGRFDQVMAAVHALFCFHDAFGSIHLVDSTQASRLLKPTMGVVGCDCGLIPIGVDQAVVSTEGLKWNLDETTLRFGALISTSNRIQAPQVSVKVHSGALLFTFSRHSYID